MDNPYYDWSPISTRPKLSWPDGARVAVCVIVNLEHLEWLPPEGTIGPPSIVMRGPYPAIFAPHEISHHEYGNRVGIFRVMDALDKKAIRATVAMDSSLAERNPYLVKACQRRDWEFIGHGVTFSRMITEQMREEEEREYISFSLRTLEHATGRAPRGWLGADYGESSRTPRLLAELGVRYVCDWPNDEQPYRMKVPTGELVALPVTVELDDVFTHRMRSIPIERWSTMIIEAFDRLYEDGASNGRVLVLNLHPYLIGQPYRIKYLNLALEHIVGHSGVWMATGSEITDWFLSQTDGGGSHGRPDGKTI